MATNTIPEANVPYWWAIVLAAAVVFTAGLSSAPYISWWAFAPATGATLGTLLGLLVVFEQWRTLTSDGPAVSTLVGCLVPAVVAIGCMLLVGIGFHNGPSAFWTGLAMAAFYFVMVLGRLGPEPAKPPHS